MRIGLALLALAVLGCKKAPSSSPTVSEQPVEPALAGRGLVVSVDSGDSHMCSLRDTGAVECWGGNEQGALGQGHTKPVAGRVAVAGLGEVVALGASSRGACTLNRAGDVYCWGHGKDTDPKPTRVALAGRGSALRVSNDDACALLVTGRGFCWKLASREVSPDGPDMPRDVRLFVGRNGDGEGTCYVDRKQSVHCQFKDPHVSGAIAIDRDGKGTCAATKQGKVLCWGHYSSRVGPPGDYEGNDGLADFDVGTELPGVSGAIDLVASRQGAIVLTSRGTIIYGAAPGLLLRGGTSEVPLPSGHTWARLSGQGSTRCAIATDGSVACSGSNEDGQFLMSIPSTGAVPAPVRGVTTSVRVSVSQGGACSLDKDGGLSCWGGNWPESGAPAQPLPGRQIVDVAVEGTGIGKRESFGCAVTSDGEVHCFGLNTGIATPYAPHFEAATVKLENLSNVVDIEIEASRACVRLRDGNVTCWGSTGMASYDLDGVVKGFRGAVAIDVASDFVCAVLGNGRVSCMGNIRPESSTPREIAGLRDVVEVRAMFSHLCARHRDGSVSCMSFDTDPATDPHDPFPATPKQVEGLQDATSLAVGHGFACATTKAGELKCWGSCEIPMGYGRACSRHATLIEGLGPAASLDASMGRVCAVQRDGAISCVGEVEGLLLEDATKWFDKFTMLPL